MEEIHKSGLIHRDISPENIMLDDDGSIKVIDFGATKKLNNKTGQIYFGKFGYAPLEQMLGEGQGPWTDVYGICATLYCMITGDIPTDAYQRSQGEPLIPMEDFGISLDQRIVDAITKGLSMDPKDRQQDMGQLARSLYGVKVTSKEDDTTQVVFPTFDSSMLYDRRNQRIWFGHYPMNEVVGASLTTDIIYANYDMQDCAMVGENKFKRFRPLDGLMSKDYKNKNFAKLKEDSRKYRFFEFSEIPWVILYHSGNKMVIQSEYILDYQMFDERDYIDMSEREVMKTRTGISWETSRIREWLNRDFLHTAFTDTEQKRIMIREVITPISSFSDEVTYDRVFLPSVDEVNAGFGNKTVRGGNGLKVNDKSGPNMISQYAAAQKVDESLPMGYGLRTRGSLNVGRGTFAYGESCDGQCILNGNLKNWRVDQPMGIRPIIQVDVNEIMEIE